MEYVDPTSVCLSNIRTDFAHPDHTPEFRIMSRMNMQPIRIRKFHLFVCMYVYLRLLSLRQYLVERERGWKCHDSRWRILVIPKNSNLTT